MYSYEKIKKSLPVKKNSNSSRWVKLLIRPISFPFTFVFINLNFSANAVSILSILTSIISCLLYALSGVNGVYVATFLINLWLVLDCVDGNIARCKQMKTAYGEFVDDIGGYYTTAFVYFAIGIAAYNHGGLFTNIQDISIVFIGAFSSISDILSRLIHKDYEKFSANVEENRRTRKLESYEIDDKRSIDYIRRRIGKEIGISGMFMPMVIIGTFFDMFDLVTVFYAIFNGFALLTTTIFYIYKADKYDRGHIL